MDVDVGVQTIDAINSYVVTYCCEQMELPVMELWWVSNITCDVFVQTFLVCTSSSTILGIWHILGCSSNLAFKNGNTYMPPMSGLTQGHIQGFQQLHVKIQDTRNMGMLGAEGTEP